MAITYKDHPLAFLAARPNALTLADTAASWRRRKLSVEGIDVAGSFDEAARLVGACQTSVRAVAASEPDMTATEIASAVVVAHAEADALFTVGQFLREDFRDPFGGSTASHLEMAADEIKHLSEGVAVLKQMALEGAAAAELKTYAKGLLGDFAVEATADAPVMRM